MMGWLFKYYCLCGFVVLGVEEFNVLLGLGQVGWFELNQCVIIMFLVGGMVIISQNCWFSLNVDIGVVNNWLYCFLFVGFYYKIFIYLCLVWKYLFELIICRLVGLGKVLVDVDFDIYEQVYVYVDLVVVGGGVVGLDVVLMVVCDGKLVIVLEQIL